MKFWSSLLPFTPCFLCAGSFPPPPIQEHSKQSNCPPEVASKNCHRAKATLYTLTKKEALLRSMRHLADPAASLFLALKSSSTEPFCHEKEDREEGHVPLIIVMPGRKQRFFFFPLKPLIRLKVTQANKEKEGHTITLQDMISTLHYNGGHFIPLNEPFIHQQLYQAC